MITHSQACDLNWFQPSARSRHGERPVGCAAGIVSRPSETRLTPNVAASTAMTVAGCVSPIRTPASAGPVTLAAD